MRFNIKNIKKSMCTLHTRNRNRHFEQMPSIKLEGVLLAWVQNVKYLGIYITSNLSEDTEVRYKQRDCISRSNSAIYKFGFATREVVMSLINSKCSHF